MSGLPQKSPSFRLSRQGFQPLDNDNMADNTHNIPLQTVVSHSPSYIAMSPEQSEKSGLFHRGQGRRRVQKVNSKGEPHPGDDVDEEKTALNRMGRIYTKILNFSIVTRYMIYVAPLALILAIPIILATTVWSAKNEDGTPKHTIGGADEKKFWIWVEIGTKLYSNFTEFIADETL
jgi:hypothetical protein